VPNWSLNGDPLSYVPSARTTFFTPLEPRAAMSCEEFDTTVAPDGSE
jgi:hypothetical protein